MKASTTEVLFVFPPAHGNLGVFRYHLGVSYLRSVLERDGISTIQYTNDYPNTVKTIASDILNYKPKIVGFTVYDANFLLALTLAQALKQKQPNVKVVFGGPTATFCSAQILELHDAVDFCIMGEAEETGTNIFTKLLEEQPLDDTQPGIAFRDSNQVICNSLPPLVGSYSKDVKCALDTTPSPYLTGLLVNGRSGVLSGRGCTHNCQYCVFAELGRRKLRLHSIDRVVAELEYIAHQQKRDGESYVVAVHDDTFTLIPNRAKKLCKAIIDQKLGLVLSCITRADTVDDELLHIMREAGFISIAFGLESAVPSVLRATGKVRHPNWHDPNLEPEYLFIEKVKKCVITAKKLGFNVGVSIILGLPTETIEDGFSTLSFVKKLPVDFYMHNFLWVFPGTPLWDTHNDYNISCELNNMGLPLTYNYAYDVTKLKPQSKCTLEQDARMIRSLTISSFYNCESILPTEGTIGVVVINTPYLSTQTASWIADILSVGGIVIQTYSKIDRKEEPSRIYHDRCILTDNLVPARHHVQLIPTHGGNNGIERWRIACSGIDLYSKYKPNLLSFRTSNDHAPINNWLKDIPTKETMCEVTSYLKDNNNDLVQFLNNIDGQNLGDNLASKQIPPDIKYSGRWLKCNPSCMKLSRIEVDAEGRVHCCKNSDSIGIVGDSFEKLEKEMDELRNAVFNRRGCKECQNISTCPRCPFPGIDDRTYCTIITKQSQTLQFLNWIHLFARIPLILDNQRDKLGGE